jgi:hypothetical protein
VVVLEEEGLDEQLAPEGRLVQPVAQAAERRWSSSRKALKGLCGAAPSPGRLRQAPWRARVPGAVDFRGHHLERWSLLLGFSSLWMLFRPRKVRDASRVRAPGCLRDGQRRCPSRRTGVPSGPGCFLARHP